MTVNELIEELETIPIRERNRDCFICGDKIENKKSIHDYSVTWIDVAEGILVLFNE